MEKSFIMKILSGDKNKETKIKVLVKYIKNPVLRKNILENIEDIVKWTYESDLVFKLIEALISYKDSIPTLKKDWKSIIENTEYGWSIIRLLGKEKEIKEELLSDLPYLIDLTTKYPKKLRGKEEKFYTLNMIQNIKNLEMGKEEILKNLTLILKNKNIGNKEVKEILKEVKDMPGGEEEILKQLPNLLNNFTRNFCDVILVLKESKKANEYVLNHLEDIIEWVKEYDCNQEAIILYRILKQSNFNPEDFKHKLPTIRNMYYEVLESPHSMAFIPPILKEMKTIEGMKDIYQENQYIMENFYATIPFQAKYTEFRFDSKLYNKTIGTIIKEGQQEKIKAIVEEIAQGEQVLPEYESNGNFSMTYKIKDKRLKIGYEKENYQIPYHPRIMYPIFRKNYRSKDQKRDLYLEVYEEGDNNHDNITDEELLQVYLELREAGIFWSDAHKRNLVRLKKDNNLPDWVIKNDHTMFGFMDNKQEHKVLKKGEVVICDLDSIYLKKETQHKYIDENGELHICFPVTDEGIIKHLKEYGEKCILQAEIEFQNRKKEERKEQGDAR